MKGFLLDENLPLGALAHPSLPVIHARQLGSQPSDTQLWQHAARNDLVIVTKDSDFSDRMMLAEAPPRVVHLRLGNMRRQAMISHLTSVWPLVEQLLPTAKLVAVYDDHVEAIS